MKRKMKTNPERERYAGWIRLLCVLTVAILMIGFLPGCNKSGKLAEQVLTDYLNNIDAGQYSKAYALLSDFDKENISEENFIKWQEQAARIAKTQSFTIDSKIDVFKDYKYLGTAFGSTYGLKVNRKQEVFLPDIERIDYDKDIFRVMVQMKGEEGRVLLLLTKIDDVIATYDAYLK